MLGSRMFYARYLGKIYGFQDKKQRDKLISYGGEYVTAVQAYKEKYLKVNYWGFENWWKNTVLYIRSKKEEQRNIFTQEI